MFSSFYWKAMSWDGHRGVGKKRSKQKEKGKCHLLITYHVPGTWFTLLGSSWGQPCAVDLLCLTDEETET